MGVVYEAEQISLKRRVALKVLPFAAVLDPRQLKRFETEALAAAGLHHGNIVPVLHFGCERAVHFYAMQYIEGQNVAELIGQIRQVTEQQTEESADTDTTILATPQSSQSSARVETALLANLSTEYSDSRGNYYRSVATLGIQAAEALERPLSGLA